MELNDGEVGPETEADKEEASRRSGQQPLLVRCLVSVKPCATELREHILRLCHTCAHSTEKGNRAHVGLHYNAGWPILKRSSPLSVTTSGSCPGFSDGS